MLKSWLQAACCLAVAAGMVLTTKQGRAAVDVSTGITNAGSDIALFIAGAKGFFQGEDIKPNFIAFVDPNGVVNVESLQKDWTFFKNQNQISGHVTVDQVVDRTFAQAVVRAPGPYRSAK